MTLGCIISNWMRFTYIFYKNKAKNMHFWRRNICQKLKNLVSTATLNLKSKFLRQLYKIRWWFAPMHLCSLDFVGLIALPSSLNTWPLSALIILTSSELTKEWLILWYIKFAQYFFFLNGTHCYYFASHPQVITSCLVLKYSLENQNKSWLQINHAVKKNQYRIK